MRGRPILIVALLLAACTSPAPPDLTPAADQTATAEPTATAVPFSDAVVDPADVDDALAFVLSLLDPDDADATLDQAAFTDRFAEGFRAQVPLAQLTAALDDLRTIGPYTVTREVSRSEVGELLVRADAADGSEVAITLVVTPQGQVSGLLLGPGDPPTLQTPVTTLQGAVDQLASRGTVRVSAATVEDEGCVTQLGVDADQQAPVASAAHLYVLAAVVDGVAEGTLTWDDQLVITADVKSLPPGQLQDRPDLSRVTVEEAAQLMVTASDNTAADLLMRTVGRAAVERAQAGYGHSDAAQNIPFMTTRELFVLKAGGADLQQRWLEGDEPTRRAVLDDVADADLPDHQVVSGDPIRPDTLGWFASPEDLCRVMVGLLHRAADPGMEPLETILMTNPGLPDTEQRWDRIAFKGGSEPGLLSVVWVVEDADGVRRALAASLVDRDAPLDEIQTILLMGAARDLLGAG